MIVLSVKNIYKRFGLVQALKNISFDVSEADIVGVIGPNGSGKTTLFAIISDILRKDSGDVQVVNKLRVNAIIDMPIFYNHLSAIEHLQVIAKINKSSFCDFDSILSTVGLTEQKTSKFSAFSMGMRQRLAIASQLVTNPDIIILDEPTNGIDPQGVIEIRKIINQLNQKGITILLSNHNLSEVDGICNKILVLQRGEIRFFGEKAKFLALYGNNIEEAYLKVIV